MSESFAVNVNAVKLRFASAHMATLGKELEPLHGHNYIVSCTVEGDITDDEWVIDFSVIKDSVRDVVTIELILIFGILNLIKNPIKKI